MVLMNGPDADIVPGLNLRLTYWPRPRQEENEVFHRAVRGTANGSRIGVSGL